jgi:transmembrane protein
MPAFIHALLAHSATRVFGRVLLTYMFWSGSLAMLYDFKGFSDAMAAIGMASPQLIAVAVIATNMIGSALLITNFRNLGWLGAGALAVFTLATIPVAHAFWTMSGPKQIEEIRIVSEHLSIVGGLLLGAILTLRVKN